MNRIALRALCAFVFTLPIENTIVIPGVGTVARIVGYLAFGVCLWCVLLRGRVHIPDTIHVLWLMFVLLVTFSLIWTFDTDLTAIHVAVYVQLLGMMWIIGEIATTSMAQQNLMAWLVIGATSSAVATVYAYRAGTAFNDSAYRYATEGFNPNDLALTFVLAIPCAWYLRSKSRSVLERGFFFVSVPVMIIGLLLTGSRGGVLSGAAALLIIPALNKRRNIGTTALLIVGAVIGVVAIIPAQSWDRIFAIREEILTGTMNDRTEIWSAGLKQFLQHPVLGVGAGAFPTAVQYVDHGIALVAHNTYLSVLVELGVVGAMVLAITIGLTWRRILSMPAIEKRLWAISLLSWSVGVFGSTFENKKMTWFLFAMIIAQARAFTTGRQCDPQTTPSRSEWLQDEMRSG